MTARKAPADGAVVAKFAYPVPITAIDRLVRALEAVFGTGLIVDSAHPEAREWMVVRNPKPAEVAS